MIHRIHLLIDLLLVKNFLSIHLLFISCLKSSKSYFTFSILCVYSLLSFLISLSFLKAGQSHAHFMHLNSFAWSTSCLFNQFYSILRSKGNSRSDQELQIRLGNLERKLQICGLKSVISLWLLHQFNFFPRRFV